MSILVLLTPIIKCQDRYALCCEGEKNTHCDITEVWPSTTYFLRFQTPESRRRRFRFWDGISANLPRSTLVHRCWEWQWGSAGSRGYKHPVDPGLGYQETVSFVPSWKRPVAVFLCCDGPPSLTWSDLRRESTFPCLRSMPVALCSNSIWAQLPTASVSQIFWPWARRRMDIQARIFLSSSGMLSCSLCEKSSQQPTSNGYIFYNRFPFNVPVSFFVTNLLYIFKSD